MVVYEDGLAPLVAEAAPLRHKIMHSLRRAIEIGALEPGTRLVEKDLCQKLNVSRTSLREALRQLHAEGILTDVNNRGLTVVSVSIDDARNIYKLRASIESLLVQQFIENATDAEFQRLQDMQSRLVDAYREGGAEEIVGTKREFYDLIAKGARNPLGHEILNKLTLLTSPLRRKSVVRPERRQSSIKEVSDLVEAILKRDVAAAAAATQVHIQHSAESVIRALQESA